MQTPQAELLKRREAVAGGVGWELRASEHMAEMPIQPPGLEAFKVKVGKSEGPHALGKSLCLDSEALGLNVTFATSKT